MTLHFLKALESVVQWVEWRSPQSSSSSVLLSPFRRQVAMFPYASLTLCLLLLAGIQQTCSVEVKVMNADKKLCLYAQLMVNFTVTYEMTGKENNTVTFMLPDNVTSTGSTCGNDSSSLKLEFGDSHLWTVNFTQDNKTYKADHISFHYNLNDSTIFINATSNQTIEVSFPLKMDEVGLDTYYSCRSNINLTADSVIQTLWNVSLQAFIPNGTLSNNATVCAADQPTTPAPTTHVSPTTVPTSTSTSTPTPTPVPQPGVGNYNVSENTTVCLMATMGLQLHYNNSLIVQIINLDPNKTITDGKCQGNSSEASLHLKSENVSIWFNFTEDGKKFILHAVTVTVTNDTYSNTNLSLWETWLGSSYMCNKQQTLNISESIAIFTYSLQVQPFSVKDNKYATAHECSGDDSSILIPIVVGAALAGLIVIVLIAYVIGRRKTYVGYQTL